MKADDRVLSMLIHGASKAGKSTLTSTAPTPILVIDAEGSWKFIRTAGFHGAPLRRITWDPNQPPPRHDGTWDVCLVSVSSWNTLRQVYSWLSQTEHDFVSVVLDSITELQRRLKTNISGDGMVKGYDGWGQMLVQMDGMIRSMRDLTLLPGPVRCVIFVAETREESGKWRPYMQGQISVSLPYWVDICGYVFASKIADGDGNLTVPICNLFVGSHPNFESGERVQGVLDDSIVNPNVSSIMDIIYQEEKVSD
jgi:hypothetical protein